MFFLEDEVVKDSFKIFIRNKEYEYEMKEMEADHITPWHVGGKTTSDNCQMLCKECNRRKSGI